MYCRGPRPLTIAMVPCTNSDTFTFQAISTDAITAQAKFHPAEFHNVANVVSLLLFFENLNRQCFLDMCTCVHILKASDFSIFLNSSSRQQGFPLRVTLENLIFSPKQPECPRDCHKYLMNILATQIQRFTLCRIDSATIYYSEIAHILESNLKYVLVDMNILWVSLSISRPQTPSLFIYLPPPFAIFLFPLFLYLW